MTGRGHPARIGPLFGVHDRLAGQFLGDVACRSEALWFPRKCHDGLPLSV